MEKLPQFGIYFENSVPHPEEIREEMEKHTQIPITCFLYNRHKSKGFEFVKNINSNSDKILFENKGYAYAFKSDKFNPFTMIDYLSNNVITDISHIGYRAFYLQGVMRIVFEKLGGKDYKFGKMHDSFSIKDLDKYCFYTYAEAIKMKGFY